MVDSNVLLDVLTDDATWASWSSVTLSQAFDTGRVVVYPIVYADVSVGFTRIEDLEDALPASQFLREPLPYPAGFVAGTAFLAYKRRGRLTSILAHRTVITVIPEQDRSSHAGRNEHIQEQVQKKFTAIHVSRIIAQNFSKSIKKSAPK